MMDDYEETQYGWVALFLMRVEVEEEIRAKKGAKQDGDLSKS